MSQLETQARLGRKVALYVLARRKATAATTLVLGKVWRVPNPQPVAIPSASSQIPVSFARARADRALAS
jgi:hypothetical protein